jgi:hypothetical protein
VKSENLVGVGDLIVTRTQGKSTIKCVIFSSQHVKLSGNDLLWRIVKYKLVNMVSNVSPITSPNFMF